MKYLCILAILVVSFPARAEPVCSAPVVLPPWNELVLRLWASGGIKNDTFKRNFPIIGETGAKILQSQGFEAEQMVDLSRCLVKNFGRRLAQCE